MDEREMKEVVKLPEALVTSEELLELLTATVARLASAERMIDAVIDGNVKVGTKARQFLGEYRFKYPKILDEV